MLFDTGISAHGHPQPAEFLTAGADAVCFLPGCERGIRALREDFPGIPAGGTLGPTGLLVPPSGESDFEDVYSSCRRQAAALKSAGADFLYLDRQTSLADLRAFVLAARGSKLSVFAGWNLGADRKKNAEDEFLPTLITLQAMGASAVGFCGLPSEEFLPLVEEALPCASVPLMLTADAQPDWTPAQYAEKIKPFLEAGVRLIGCGKDTTPQHFRALRGLTAKYGRPDIPKEPDCYAAATEREVFFLGDDLEFSEPIRCSSLLGDHLIRLDDEEASAALVLVESIDDAVLLGKNSCLAKLPVVVHADNPTVLEAALRYFQGRLIIDSGSPIEREVLEPLAAKYGAVIY